MKRFVRDAVVAVTTLALVLPVAAFAQRGPKGGPRGAVSLVRVLEKNSERLGLQKPVLEQIRAISEDERKAVGAIDERKRSVHEAMRTMLDEPVPDESKVMAQADVLGDLDTQMHKERLRSLIAIRRLLSADQLAELNKIQAERRTEMEQRHSGGGRHPRGGGGPGFPPPNQTP